MKTNEDGKLCLNCKRTYPILEIDENFNKNRARSDGYQDVCKLCQSYYRETNPRIHRPTASYPRIQKKQILVDKLKEMGCQLCTESDSCCLDFHHIQPKQASIKSLIRNGTSEYALVLELWKCVLVCANCHRKAHAGKVAIPPSLQADFRRRLELLRETAS